MTRFDEHEIRPRIASREQTRLLVRLHAAEDELNKYGPGHPGAADLRTTITDTKAALRALGVEMED